MVIGIPSEIKNGENRVGITPAGVASLVRAGHDVLVESAAGAGSGFSDESYAAQGARIVSSAAEAWAAEMVMKVKEPVAAEYGYFRKDLLLFCYLHLASEPALTDALLESGVTSIAYETIQLHDGSLPLLAPMSQVAGRMSTQIGAQLLEGSHGGKGVLLAGVPGVDAGRVTVVGGGIVGTNAAKIAAGMGAQVTLLDINPARLRYVDDVFQGRVQTRMSNGYNIARAVESADLLIGAVLIPGAKAPCLVTEEMVASMEPGSVVVDVAIDQGGCVETADHVTTHSEPTYVRHGVVHYSVGNMPGAVARTSTLALTNATVPYAVEIASGGFEKVVGESIPLARGVNTVGSCLTCRPVADSLGLEFVELSQMLPSLSLRN